jgi:Protein of unknown function (DUF1236)
MKHSLLIAFTALSVAAGTQAFAQATIQVSPEQRTTIREYVVKQKTPSVNIQGDVRVGAPLPADVQLVVVPGEWGPSYSRYRYVHWNNKVVLVDPSNRQVVHIVE